MNPCYFSANAATAHDTTNIFWSNQSSGKSDLHTARRAYEGHEKIYEAIAAHNVEAADQAVADHLKMVSEAYWKAMAAKTK